MAECHISIKENAKEAARLSSLFCMLSARAATHRTAWAAVSSWTTWTTWTSTSASCLIEITEAVGKREDYITSECVVTSLLMVVGIITHREILRLSEDVVCLESKSELLLEQKLCDLSIENHLIFLRCSISDIPIVVSLSNKVDSSWDCPVHRGIDAVAPGVLLITVLHCIPRL